MDLSIEIAVLSLYMRRYFKKIMLFCIENAILMWYN